jgi:MFS family permease
VRDSATLRLLRTNPDFTRVYLAQLISFAGDWFATVALLGLALELTGSTAVTSLVLVLQTGPFFLVAPFAGAVADRLDRRRLMIGADLVRVVICAGFLLVQDADTLWIGLLCVTLLSVGAAFFEPASASALPNLVEPRDLKTANALMGSAWGTMVAVGAAVGGVVAATLGRDVAFVINGASFLVSALLLLSVHRSFQARRADRGPDDEPEPLVPMGLAGVRSSIGETLALARGSRTIAAFLLTKTSFGAGMGVLVLLAVFGREVFQGGDIGIGVLYAARGLGALVGPFAARRWAGDDDRAIIRAISVAVVVFIVAYGLLPIAPGLAAAAACVFVAHMGGGSEWMLSSYALQRSTPDAVRGRVLSIDFALVTLTTAVSQLIAGALATVVGPVETLYVMVAIVAVTGGLWLVWTRPLRRAPALATATGSTTLPG